MVRRKGLEVVRSLGALAECICRVERAQSLTGSQPPPSDRQRASTSINSVYHILVLVLGPGHFLSAERMGIFYHRLFFCLSCCYLT